MLYYARSLHYDKIIKNDKTITFALKPYIFCIKFVSPISSVSSLERDNYKGTIH